MLPALDLAAYPSWSAGQVFPRHSVVRTGLVRAAGRREIITGSDFEHILAQLSLSAPNLRPDVVGFAWVSSVIQPRGFTVARCNRAWLSYPAAGLACWLAAHSTAFGQAASERRQRFVQLLLERQDRMAVEMIERQIRRTEAQVERLSRREPSSPQQAERLQRSLAAARGRVSELQQQALSPSTPARRALEIQAAQAEARVASLTAQLDRLLAQGARRMSPRQRRLYEQSVASLRADIERAVEQRDFVERLAASPTTP